MASTTSWAPAPRPGIIPLHPMTFGTILARSFAALRHNPKVLLGFALVVLSAVYLLLLVGIGVVTIWAVGRLETVQLGTDDADAIAAGTALTIVLASLGMSLVASALQIVVQGVVVTETASAAVAERLTLRLLWRKVRPVAWRLVGYSLLVAAAVSIAVVAVFVVLIALAAAGAGALVVVLSILVVLGSIPLGLWLGTKLSIVPIVIILEGAGIRTAIARSWTLTRGRFWPILGILVVVNMAFGIAGQIVSIPLGLFSMATGTIFTPTGDPNVQAIIGLLITSLLASVAVLLVQAVAVIVLSSAAALIYIDCRMRREALDIDLLAYVEARDAGRTDLPDPWRQHIGRIVERPAAAPYAPQPGYAQPGYPQPGYAQPGYPAPGYAAPGYAQPGYAQPGYAQPGYPQAAYPPPGYAAPTVPQPGHPVTGDAPPADPHPGYAAPIAPSDPPPPAAPGATQWAAPGDRAE